MGIVICNSPTLPRKAGGLSGSEFYTWGTNGAKLALLKALLNSLTSPNRLKVIFISLQEGIEKRIGVKENSKYLIANQLEAEKPR